MAGSAGTPRYLKLREQFPYMEFTAIETLVDANGLHVTYEFSLAGKYTFRPSFSVSRRRYLKNFPVQEKAGSPEFRNLLFQIGMIELISYWKLACPPRVIIRTGHIDEAQDAFWKKIYFQGLGEFFYTNEIQASPGDFMQIESYGPEHDSFSIELDDTVIVPIGGGKDSVVSLELLHKQYNIRPFIMNPRGATLECARVAGFGNEGFIEITRRLDRLMLQLNDKGFLNGHTPFSALLAFYTLLVSAVSGHRHIALSNESSANEPTVAGTMVNHQYSKSYEFESDFRNYVRRFVSADFNYFSFLRPLNELQIAKLFSANVKYYPVFKSCNAGSKTDVWCCNCPKCLFAFTILSPFIPMIELIHIFGQNLFELPSMIPHFKELIGLEDAKPFECVGTIDEVNAAVQLFMRQYGSGKLPLLIDYYTNTSQSDQYSYIDALQLLESRNDHYFLLPQFRQIINQALA